MITLKKNNSVKYYKCGRKTNRYTMLSIKTSSHQNRNNKNLQPQLKENGILIYTPISSEKKNSQVQHQSKTKMPPLMK